MNFLKHCYWAVRYGDWYMDWVQYEGKPQFGFFHDYYDGYHAVFHCYKFYIGVSY